jgi:hypothetical protein
MKRNRPWILCDIDGTIADPAHRAHLIPTGDARKMHGGWDAYTAQCEQDSLIYPVATLLTSMNATTNIAFVTGRNERFREETRQWLWKHLGIIGAPLYMRQDKDVRPAQEVKQEIYDLHFRNVRRVLFVLEDERACVDMWRSLGLLCLQPKDA